MRLEAEEKLAYRRSIGEACRVALASKRRFVHLTLGRKAVAVATIHFVMSTFIKHYI